MKVSSSVLRRVCQPAGHHEDASDLFAESEAPVGVSCRIYQTPTGSARGAVELWCCRVDSPGEQCDDLSVPLVLPPDSPCSFCAYLIGERPYTILHRDELSAILVTWEQRGLGHVLVIPVAHRATVIDLGATERSALMDGVVAASNAIIGAYDPDGVAVWQNNGLPANQTVPHTHFHVAGTVPGGGTIWGDVDRLSLDETDKIAARLEPHLSLLD